MEETNTSKNKNSLSKDFLNDIDKITMSLNSVGLQQLGNYLIQKGLSTNHAKPSDDGLVILYGSQTGNSRSIAEELFEATQKEKINSSLISMGKIKEKSLKSIKNLIVIVSTQGEGDPPDDALNLVDYINSNKAPKINNMNFGVLALGDSSYEFYCKTGKDFDSRLQELGGKRVIDRVDLDVDFDDDAELWIKKAVQIMKPLIPKKTEQVDIVFDLPPISEKKYTRKKPLKTKILTNQKITGRFSDKNIRHIEIDLEESGLNYQAGDSLGVWFTNNSLLVEDLLKTLKINPSEIIQINNEPLIIKDVLINTYELTQLHPDFVKDYADITHQEELLKISKNSKNLQNFIKDRQIIDVVKQFPSKISSTSLIKILRKITPRLYSISSSQSEVEEEVHLTVSVVEYDAFGFLHQGGASGHLNNLQPDSNVKVYVEASDHFRLPENTNLPIIMIGPGTGIAPFRAFLQERAAKKSSGKNWLFFGNPYFAEDFLYQTEWQNFQDEGILNRIDLAFSRDQDEKIYVQNRILEASEELWKWIVDGAHIYVCGDESRMAKDVNDALIHVILNEGKMNKEDAVKYLDNLRRNGRYQKDVY